MTQMYDKNGKMHSKREHLWHWEGGEDVAADWDEIDDDEDVNSEDSDYSTTTSYYWHGKYVEKEEFDRLEKRHTEWAENIQTIQPDTLKTWLADPEFVTDFLGDVDLEEALLKNKNISAEDYKPLENSSQELRDTLEFLGSLRADQDNDIFVTLSPEGKVEARYHVKDGLRDGLYEEYNDKGTCCRRYYYKKGKKEGPYEDYVSGQLRDKAFLVNGKFHGHYERMSQFGKMSANYKNGVEDGPFSWHNGNYKKDGFYKDGKFTGTETRYWYGKFENRTFKDDLLDGPYAEYYDRECTKPSVKCTYVNGERHGKCEFYHENGMIQERCKFFHGKRHGLSELYNDKGALIKKVIYKDGEVDHSAAAKERLSTTRKGVCGVLNVLNKLPVGETRKSLKRTTAKAYRAVVPRSKDKDPR